MSSSVWQRTVIGRHYNSEALASLEEQDPLIASLQDELSIDNGTLVRLSEKNSTKLSFAQFRGELSKGNYGCFAVATKEEPTFVVAYKFYKLEEQKDKGSDSGGLSLVYEAGSKDDSSLLRNKPKFNTIAKVIHLGRSVDASKTKDVSDFLKRLEKLKPDQAIEDKMRLTLDSMNSGRPIESEKRQIIVRHYHPSAFYQWLYPHEKSIDASKSNSVEAMASQQYIRDKSSSSKSDGEEDEADVFGEARGFGLEEKKDSPERSGSELHSECENENDGQGVPLGQLGQSNSKEGRFNRMKNQGLLQSGESRSSSVSDGERDEEVSIRSKVSQLKQPREDNKDQYTTVEQLKSSLRQRFKDSEEDFKKELETGQYGCCVAELKEIRNGESPLVAYYLYRKGTTGDKHLFNTVDIGISTNAFSDPESKKEDKELRNVLMAARLKKDENPIEEAISLRIDPSAKMRKTLYKLLLDVQNETNWFLNIWERWIGWFYKKLGWERESTKRDDFEKIADNIRATSKEVTEQDAKKHLFDIFHTATRKRNWLQNKNAVESVSHAKLVPTGSGVAFMRELFSPGGKYTKLAKHLDIKLDFPLIAAAKKDKGCLLSMSSLPTDDQLRGGLAIFWNTIWKR